MAFTQNSINNLLATTSLTGILQAAQFPALTGDVTTSSGSLATTIAANAVTTSKINNSAVTLAKIQNAAANSVLLGAGAAGSGAAYSEITLGTNISMSGTVLNVAGTFSPLPQTVVSGTSQTAAVNNGYITNNVALCTVTLPTTISVGQLVQVSGQGAGGWKIAQSSGQSIVFNSNVTTTGATGSLASTLTNDSVTLMCTVANTTFLVIASQGNITGA